MDLYHQKNEWIRVLGLGENGPGIFVKMNCPLNYNGIGHNHYPPSRIYLDNRVHMPIHCRLAELTRNEIIEQNEVQKAHSQCEITAARSSNSLCAKTKL